MTATAEAYGFGARAPYAQPRASEYDMKERVRLSGLFPRVRNQPMSVQLQALMKEFESNAALAGILERRRRLEEKTQYEMRSREAVAALLTNLAPPFRTGNASFATSAAIAQKVANEVPAPLPPAPLPPAPLPPAPLLDKRLPRGAKLPDANAPDAADVMTGLGSYTQGGSVSSNAPINVPPVQLGSNSEPAKREVRGRSKTPVYPSNRTSRRQK